MSSVVSMKQLLEAGVHFGHQTRRWNPKMSEYIFTERNGIYIIDLQKTVKMLNEAYTFVRDIAADGKDILFVGTKKQAQESIKEEALNCSMPYVDARWLGGMLTNFTTIRRRIKRLEQLRAMEADGTFDLLPKKEVIKLRLDMEKLEKYLGGIENMTKLPGALFIVDTRKERNAVAEAKKLGIPIVAIVDTNCDPDEVDAVIPANDDAIRAVKLIAQTISAAVIEGRQGAQEYSASPEGEEDDGISAITAEDISAMKEEKKPAKKTAAKKADSEEKAEVKEEAEEKPAKKTAAKKAPAKKAAEKEEVKEAEEKPAKKAPAKKTAAKKAAAEKEEVKAEEKTEE